MSDEELELELPPEEEAVEEEPEYISDLKRQIEAERAGRQAAEQRLHQAARETHRARSEVDETNFQLVVNAIHTVSRDMELLKQAHTYALQSGDFAHATEIQSEMSANAAKLLQLENGKQAMENAPRQPEPQMPPADPVEDFASRLSPRSADWVRRHPEFVRDPRLNAKMIAAHNLAVADGIPTDSDDYFAAIEETLKVAPKNETDDSYSAKVVQRRDAAPAAAPANRGNQSRSTNVVRLSAVEREMAEMMGMKPEDYAKNKITLKKEGKMQ